MRRYVPLVGVLLVSALWFGSTLPASASPAAKAPADKAPAKKGPTAGQALSNAGLTAKVKAALLADKVAPGLAINVDSDNGMVTLSGDVDSAQQKKRAVQVAKKVKGVKSVADHLKVKAKKHAVTDAAPIV
jgi:hyperosmotically inducible protein